MFRSLACRAARATTSTASAGSSARAASFTMPLRAKVSDRTYATRSPAGMDLDPFMRPQPDDAPNDVVFTSNKALRTIELNRPAKLNSLDASMIRKILPRLVEWEKSHMANVVVMKGAGDKAFCAGGDVAALAKVNSSSPYGWQNSSKYFDLEYKLDHYIATYQKPYVAFMDGITMGGGVGLSVHAPFRIATERTMFAMPETTIGFFPDVGASFFLPRMDGGVGTYLALTSDRLHGANVFYAGIATHYLHSTSLAMLEDRLGELRFRDYDTLETRLKLINAVIEEFATGLPHDEPIHLAGELRRAIDRCFGAPDTVDGIVKALQREQGAMKSWADKTLATLRKRSPTSLHVALRQMRVGRKWSIAETFRREAAMATKFMRHPDFTEGVTALLVDKSKPEPKWQPSSLDEVRYIGEYGGDTDIAKPFFDFEGVPEKWRLKLLVERDYDEYPHARLGVPREAEVAEVVASGGEMKTAQEVVKEVVDSRGGRQGIKDVVEEIVSRKTKADGQGLLRWVE